MRDVTSVIADWADDFAAGEDGGERVPELEGLYSLGPLPFTSRGLRRFEEFLQTLEAPDAETPTLLVTCVVLAGGGFLGEMLRRSEPDRYHWESDAPTDLDLELLGGPSAAPRSLRELEDEDELPWLTREDGLRASPMAFVAARLAGEADESVLDFVERLAEAEQSDPNDDLDGGDDREKAEFGSLDSDEEGEELLPERRDYLRRLQQLRRQLQDDAENGALYAQRAQIYLEAEDWDRAEADLAQAMQLGCVNAEMCAQRAHCLLELNDFAAAVEFATQGIQADATCAAAYVMRARAHYCLQDYAPARTDAEAALRLDGNQADAWFVRGSVCMEENDFSAAVRDFSETLRCVPDSVAALSRRGFCLEKLGQWEASLADDEAALALDADDAELQNNLAWILAACPVDSLRDGPRALELARAACRQTDYEEAQHLDTLAAACAETGQFGEAARRVQEAIAIALEQGEDVAELQGRLECYVREQPYRMPAAAGASPAQQ